MKYASFSCHSVHVTALLSCLLVLAGCSDKSSTSSQGGQWVAKVNDHEITVHQVNAELNSAGQAAAALPPDVAQRQAVESAVNRRLLVDAAIKAKQDRDPEVMQAIEQAKEQVIAQAYLRKTLGAQVTPSQEEVKNYYNKNPDLFAKRLLLDMRQLTIETAAVNDEILLAVDQAHSLDEVGTSLAAKSVAFKKGRAMRTTADLPAQMRENMSTLLNGKPFVIRTGPNVIVATLSAAGEAPLSLQEASPQIVQYLANTRGRDAMAGEVTRLRKEARIEYKSGYGPAAAPAATSVGGEKTADNATPASVDRAAAGLR